MKIALILILLCSLSSCMSVHESAYVALIDELTAKYVHKTTQEGFYVFGIGGGMSGEINRVIIDFARDELVDIPTARELIVRKEEEFLAMMNQDRQVRPYLREYPATNKMFKLGLIFENENDFASAPNIAIATVMMGVITYNVCDPETRKLSQIYEEPYEEAYQIVFGDKCL